MTRIALAIIALVSLYDATSRGQVPAYLDQKLPPVVRAKDLVSRMTLEEKASQMVNAAAAIDRLGVPSYDYWSEGLHGVARSGYATLFPQAIGMAATWDTALLHDIGTVVSTEARAKYNDAVQHGVRSIYYGLTIWSPNINIFRDPRWGRGQETYGEDPFLTSELGTSFVKGIQGDDPEYYRAIATPKHFAVHSGPESQRHSMNVSPTEHDLWDTYLPAFRSTVTEGHADSIMCAYNAVDNQPACGSTLLLHSILRGSWGFSGFVVTDCKAIEDFYSKTGHHVVTDQDSAVALALRAGTDLNCGSSYLALTDAVKRGLISESEVDTGVERLMEARIRLGLFDTHEGGPYAKLTMQDVRSPQHLAKALQATEESIVLLKNAHNTLPLKTVPKTIAVVGPNASALAALEGNYSAIAMNPVLPVDGLAAEFPGAKILYAQGSPYVEGLPLPLVRTRFHSPSSPSQEGLLGEYFDNDSLSGVPAFTRVDKQLDFDWGGASPAPGISAKRFSVRWSGTLSVPKPGDYKVSAKLAPCYPCADFVQLRIWLDGKMLDDFSVETKFRNSETPVFTMRFDDVAQHEFKLEYVHRTELFGAGFTLVWTPPADALRSEAVEAAKKADAVIAFVGLSPALEGEQMPLNVPGFSGGDRTDLNLPSAQLKLLRELKNTGKPLIVVLMNGSALALQWAQQNANAVLEAWYPGEAGAQAIAQTLSGKNNPSGRLPVTFYTGVDQLPAFDSYDMSQRTYRYFEGKPLYGFGYGLSYTTFSYFQPHMSETLVPAGQPLQVSVKVQNTGNYAGDDVVELYLVPPHRKPFPNRSLESFQRVHLAPGETRTVFFTLSSRQLSEVDADGTRKIFPGDYKIMIGGSQPEEGPSTQLDFTVVGEQSLPR